MIEDSLGSIFSKIFIPESPPDKNTEIISEDATDFVPNLKTQEGKDICVMGGGVLAKSLFEANLIDEVGLNIHPILLGSGITHFDPLQLFAAFLFGHKKHLITTPT